MGGLFSKESECIKECKVKSNNTNNPNNDQTKIGLMATVTEKLKSAKNIVSKKMSGKPQDQQGQTQDQQGQTQDQQGQPQDQQGQPPSMSGGTRKSKKKRYKKRKIGRLKKSKRSHKKKKRNKK